MTRSLSERATAAKAVHSWLAMCVAVVAVACAQSGPGTATSKAAPKPSVGPVSVNQIDSIALSDAELQSLGITYERRPADDGVPSWGNVDQSDPCQQLEWVADLQPFSAFRFVDSAGPSNFGIHQTVAIYADPPSAGAIFSKYSDLAASCKAKGGKETFTATTSTELAWSAPTTDEVGANVGNIAAWNIRLVKNVVVDVQSLRRRDGVAMAGRIADQVVAKVNAAQ